MAVSMRLIRRDMLGCHRSPFAGTRQPVRLLFQTPKPNSQGSGRQGRFWQSWRRMCDNAGQTQGKGFLAWYNGMLQKAPVPTKAITSGILFGAGDGIAQLLSMRSEKGTPFDLPRFLRASAFGFFFLGPLAHLHFNFLEYLVVKRLAVSAALMPFAKVGIEQFTYWAPVINAFYHFIIGFMEGIGFNASIDRVKERWLPTMKANYTIWPAVQLLNFKLVPIAHQLNFVLVVSLGWAVYLSSLGGAKAAESAESVEAEKADA
ncbi:uncharacterized protein LOC135823939 [Sycon ciliatum]|uniref:uncharacterized protein LOC135823939 n=1 Tax=Sycon ciliatum TaxID=27933 RepID=UPI0031F70A9A